MNLLLKGIIGPVLISIGIGCMISRSDPAPGESSLFDAALERRLDEIRGDRLFVERIKPLVASILRQESPLTKLGQLKSELNADADGRLPTLGVELSKARVYWLAGDDSEAMEVLNCVLSNFGEEKVPGLQIPASLLAKLWIATLHRWNGRHFEAVEVYEEIASRKWSEQIEEFVLPICRLYLNKRVSRGSEELAIANREDPKEVSEKERAFIRGFYLELEQMIAHPLHRDQGKVRRINLERGFRPGSLQLLMVHHLMLIGVLSDPIFGFEEIPGVREGFLEMARRSGDLVDRELAGHLLGSIAVATRNWPKAESIYNELFWCGTLRLPQSGLSLARCQALKGDPESAARTLNEVVQSFPNQAFEVFKLRKQILP